LKWAKPSILKNLDIDAGETVILIEVILVGGERNKFGVQLLMEPVVKVQFEKHGLQKKVTTFVIQTQKRTHIVNKDIGQQPLQKLMINRKSTHKNVGVCELIHRIF